MPQPARRGAHLSVQGLQRWATPTRVALRWRRGLSPRGPVFVAGAFGSASGVGQGARLFADAVEAAGVAVRRIDVGPSLSKREVLGGDAGAWRGLGVLVSHLNPFELGRWLAGPGAGVLRGKRHIGYWVWELETAPPAWRAVTRYVDEIWRPSRFTDMAEIADGAMVRTVPHPIFALPEAIPDRARFGLSPDVSAVLTAFDLRSSVARKNPFGALEAYGRAVPEPDPRRAVLVCKMRGEDADPALARRLAEACAGRPDIRLLREDLDEAAMLSLVASVDVVLSLHRSEGFGLIPAEAIWLGKPVVATAFGGLMDFLDAEGAALIPWTRVPVDDAQAIYRGGTWAEPDVDAAAETLRGLIADPAMREALGRRGRARAEAVFDRGRWLATALPLLTGTAQPLDPR